MACLLQLLEPLVLGHLHHYSLSLMELQLCSEAPQVHDIPHFHNH